MLTDVEGVTVGHWTHPSGATGCTVVVLPPDTVASGEIRGGAPASREFALLNPSRMIPSIDAVMLSGGSAFGLACADGAMRELGALGRGFPTAGGTVPIVVGLSVFDLARHEGIEPPQTSDQPVDLRGVPDAESGRAAFVAADSGPYAVGRVGAGAGATYRKWWGPARTRPGGIGTATIRSGAVTVSALMVVNAIGDIVRPGHHLNADSLWSDAPRVPPRPDLDEAAVGGAEGSLDGVGQNTTIGVVVTNAVLTKPQCYLLAQSGHDGMARAIEPAHMNGDGDALVVAATGAVEADLDHLRALAAEAVERAIVRVAVPFDEGPAGEA